MKQQDELATEQARDKACRELLKTIELMYPELQAAYWKGEKWQNLKKEYGGLEQGRQ